MKAVLSKDPGPGSTLVIEDIPEPVPGPNQVLIDVKACSINFPDVLLIEDKYQAKPPRPFTPGMELSGVVSRIGREVSGLQPGMRVLAGTSVGGLAEKVVVDARMVTPIPDSMPFDEAAALVTTYATSLYAIRDRGRAQAGETLFVLGAGGGVGLAAVDLGKALGMRVIAAASSQEKIDLALSRGAEAGVVYPRGPFDKAQAKSLAALFKQACGPKGWDVAYDGVGGDYSEATIRASGWGGRLLVVGFTAGIASIPLNLALLKSCEIVGVFWGAEYGRDYARKTRVIDDLLKLYVEGKIRPHISQRFSFEQAGAAIQHLADRKALGKIVVMIGQER